MEESLARRRMERRAERWFFYLSMVSIWFITMLLIIDPVPIKYIFEFLTGAWFLVVLRLLCIGRT